MIFKKLNLLKEVKLIKSKRLLQHLNYVSSSSNKSDLSSNFYSTHPDAYAFVNNSLEIYDNFVTIDEEKNLLDQVQKYLENCKYEHDHWDDAITLYREVLRANWSKKNSDVIQRIQLKCFPSNLKTFRNIHVLDLHQDGIIKPHVDSVRFCGPVIAGLSLLSDSVMRFTHEKQKTLVIDLLLKQRSLYVIKGIVRYEFKHEILGNPDSFFKNEPVLKKRRVSLISRCEPID